MDVLNTVFGGVMQIAIRRKADTRGSFNKFFYASDFEKNGLQTDFLESYYTVSRPGVVRGMHFQSPPSDHAKLVTIVSGRAVDVVLDLRKSSNTFGCAASFDLSDDTPTSIYIPKGFAHGFAALSDCVLLYNVTTEYAPLEDAGVRWDSFGFEWPFNDPLVSDRDKGFPLLSDFLSLF